MKNFLKQVTLLSSIIKNKLIQMFILKILYLYYEKFKRESKNTNDICWVETDKLMN